MTKLAPVSPSSVGPSTTLSMAVATSTSTGPETFTPLVPVYKVPHFSSLTPEQKAQHLKDRKAVLLNELLKFPTPMNAQESSWFMNLYWAYCALFPVEPEELAVEAAQKKLYEAEHKALVAAIAKKIEAGAESGSDRRAELLNKIANIKTPLTTEQREQLRNQVQEYQKLYDAERPEHRLPKRSNPGPDRKAELLNKIANIKTPLTTEQREQLRNQVQEYQKLYDAERPEHRLPKRSNPGPDRKAELLTSIAKFKTPPTAELLNKIAKFKTPLTAEQREQLRKQMQEYEKLYDAKHPEHRLSKRSKRKDMENMYAKMLKEFEYQQLQVEEDMLFAEIEMMDNLRETLNEMERAKNPYNPRVWHHVDVLELLEQLPRWCLRTESRFGTCIAQKFGATSGFLTDIY
jgi:hypothetical protein